MSVIEKPPLWKVLYLTARPKTLGASIAPIVMGIAIGIKSGYFHLFTGICTLVGGVMIQVLANYANDYFDYLKGADKGERLGPIRASTAGWLKPREMKLLLGIITALCMMVGLYLVWRGGLPILIVGVVSIVLAYAYTSGPCPLAYIGLGDVFVLIFFGPVAVAGTYYLQALKWDVVPVVVGFAPGALSVAILTVNNYRDIELDKKSGKKTLAVRFGERFAVGEYTFSIITGVVVIPLIVSVLFEKYSILGICILAIPGIWLVRSFLTLKGSELNTLLANTTKFLLAYGVLFSILWQI